MEWKDMETGMNVLSCTMIVTSANALAGKVHYRMPVVTTGGPSAGWRAPPTEMLKPAPNDHLQEVTNSLSQGAASVRVRMVLSRRDVLHRRGSVRSSPRRLRAR